MYTLLFLAAAPFPALLANARGSGSDFGGGRKTSSQESGLFLTSACATSALGMRPSQCTALMCCVVFPVFLYHLEKITGASAIYTCSGAGSVVLAITLYQVFFNIKEESSW